MTPRSVTDVLLAASLCMPGVLVAFDCNRNGVEDELEVLEGSAPDCNRNGHPDSCELIATPGGLETGTAVPVETTARGALVVVDVDADGWLDALVHDEHGTALYFLRGGPDGFSRAASPALVEDGGLCTVVAGDWSGDGRADLACVVCEGRARSLRLWRSTPDGFEPAPHPPESEAPRLALGFADMDLDGALDLVECTEDELRVHWNEGGAFADSVSAVPVQFPYLRSMRLVEADDNERPDVILIWDGVGLVQSDGARGFREFVPLRLPGVTPKCIVGDLDGDGKADLLTADTSLGPLSALRWHTGKLREGFLASAPVLALSAADLDGDGADDPILVHPGFHEWENWIQVRRSSDDWTLLHRGPSVPGAVAEIAPGDVDRDGDLDLVVLAGTEDGKAAVIVLENVPRAPSLDADGDRIPDACTGGDCNGNGLPDAGDIAAGTSRDADGDGVPDECEPDCNANGEADDSDLRWRTSLDEDRNGIPDECESPSFADCNANGIADAIDFASGEGDCDGDGRLDACEVAPEVLLSPDSVHRVGLRAAPRSATAADLDSDGDLDAVFGGRTECHGPEPRAGSVHVLINLGEGRLAATGLHRLGGDPVKVAPGDHDADGDVDIFILEGSSPCAPDARSSVLLNRGKGAFDRGPAEPVPPGSASLAAGDLDGDGRTDLAIGNPHIAEGCVIILQSRGSGLDASAVGPQGGATAVAMGDWNGDGLADLAASSASREAIHVLLVTAGGAFIPAAEVFDERARPSELLSWDFDADGDLDLVRRDSDLLLAGREFRFLAGDGRGGFAVLTRTDEPGPSQIAHEDLDGDEKEDVIIATPFHTDFSPPSSILEVFRIEGEERIPLEESLQGFFIGADPILPLAGDWTGDGRSDILLADVEGKTASILRSSGTGSRFFTASNLETGFEARDLEAADLDADGDPDLAQLDERRSEVRALLNTAGEFEGPAFRLSLQRARALSAGDIDEDGDLDLVIAAQFRVALVFNDGRGSLTGSRSYPVGSNPVHLVVLDLDGDGDLDAATGNALGGESHNVTILRNAGEGEYEPGRNYRTGLGNQAMSTADMDSDGDPDLVLSVGGLYDGTIVLLRNDGGAVFGDPERLLDRHFVSESLLLGDVDGDQDPDLIVKDGLFLNRGDAVLLPGQELGFTNLSFKIARGLVDIDGDQDPDLITVHAVGYHWLEVQKNDGLGSFGVPLVSDAGQSFASWFGPGNEGEGSRSPSPSAIADSDFDGDGDLDLALGFTTRRWITVAWNRTVQAKLDLDRDGAPDSCAESPDRFRRGDADGSGRMDLTDAIRLFRWLFLSGQALPCEKSGDADDDGRLGITDGVRVLNHLFLGAEPPPAPHPGCGADPTPDGLPCGASCG